jgi:hypothetical protein
MPIKYENIVPWGRSYEEYVRMFDLNDMDLTKRIISCGDGPASFNAGMIKQGFKITSFDPIYQFTKKQLEIRIKETYDIVIEQTSKNLDRFVWTTFKSLEEVGRERMSAMKEFLNDYEMGLTEERYIFGELPVLPYENKSYDLVLSAHFLLFYSDNLTLDFHLESIKEMCRVGQEIRIFPILDLNANPSRYLEPVKDFVHTLGWTTEEIKVNYEFQKNGNKMLRIVEKQ